MTIKEFVSTISTSIKAENIDDFISPKFIYSLSQQAIADFLKKENSASRLTYKLVSGWTEIPIIPMEEVPVTECNLGVYQCQKLMKSKYRLPEIYESKFGAIIRQVMSLNLNVEYTNIYSPKQWLATTKREFGKERYYFFIDGYLYIPIRKLSEGSPEQIRIEAYFKDKYHVAQFIDLINGSCEDCKTKIDKCKKQVEYEMVIPTGLQNDVKGYVLQQLAGIYVKIVPDNLPNSNTIEKTNQNIVG